MATPNFKLFTNYRDGLRGIFGDCLLNAAGFEIAGGSGSALISNANAFAVRSHGIFSAPVSANATLPVLGGGNLAFDNGTVPQTTLSCRCYTIYGTVSATTGAVTFSVLNGVDFTKYTPMVEGPEINLGDSTGAILGFLYVKNESSAAFVPGTTHLDATGITARFSDVYGYIVG